MTEKDPKYEVVLKDKDKDDKFLTIPCDEYNLDFIVHAFTGMTQLNLFCIIKDDNGKISDECQCQAFTIPWENILYIRQLYGLKTTIEKANAKMKKDGDNFNKVVEEHMEKTKNDVSVG